ncbi:hypothetical protein D3C71_1264000 [compost metagenome]
MRLPPRIAQLGKATLNDGIRMRHQRMGDHWRVVVACRAAARNVATHAVARGSINECAVVGRPPDPLDTLDRYDIGGQHVIGRERVPHPRRGRIARKDSQRLLGVVRLHDGTSGGRNVEHRRNRRALKRPGATRHKPIGNAIVNRPTVVDTVDRHGERHELRGRASRCRCKALLRRVWLVEQHRAPLAPHSHFRAGKLPITRRNVSHEPIRHAIDHRQQLGRVAVVVFLH